MSNFTIFHDALKMPPGDNIQKMLYELTNMIGETNECLRAISSRVTELQQAVMAEGLPSQLSLYSYGQIPFMPVPMAYGNSVTNSHNLPFNDSVISYSGNDNAAEANVFQEEPNAATKFPTNNAFKDTKLKKRKRINYNDATKHPSNYSTIADSSRSTAINENDTDDTSSVSSNNGQLKQFDGSKNWCENATFVDPHISAYNPKWEEYPVEEFDLDRNLQTCTDLWKEWNEGTEDKPSVEFMDKRYRRSKWVRTAGVKKFAERRQKIIREMRHFVNEGIPLSEVLREANHKLTHFTSFSKMIKAIEMANVDDKHVLFSN